MESISEKIVRLRKKNRYNQKDFSKKIGVSQPSLIKFEKGETDIITINVGLKIARELDISFNELFEIEGSGAENNKLKNKINDLNEIIKNNDIVISQLLNRVVDKELIIDLLQKEKIAFKKDIIRFLEETYDTQIDYLDRYSSFSTFQKKEIQNTILSLMNNMATAHFVTTGLISKSELDKIIPKYTGIVRPADPEEEE